MLYRPCVPSTERDKQSSQWSLMTYISTRSEAALCLTWNAIDVGIRRCNIDFSSVQFIIMAHLLSRQFLVVCLYGNAHLLTDRCDGVAGENN
jgi:hypothetical protein